MKHFVSVFIHNEAFGTFFRGDRLAHAEPQSPPSYAWACSVCGEIWARAVVPGAEFQFINTPCLAHQDSQLRYRVPGSLLGWDTAFDSALSLDLWRRELEVHLKYYENLGDRNDDSND